MRYRTVTRIMIDDNSRIKTEAQLAKFIFDNFGTGRYMCLGYQRGYSGFWNFWIGEIMENGFIRDRNVNREVDKLKKELQQTDSYEEREAIEEEIELEKEIHNLKKRYVRRGPVGIIRLKPGILHNYEDY